jgi:D-alanine-D-alanine ligase-like ATP-grasp enzyme
MVGSRMMNVANMDSALGDDQWVVTLHSGSIIPARAQAYARENAYLDFSGLVIGRPPTIVNVAWIR